MVCVSSVNPVPPSPKVRRFDEHILIHVTDLYRAARRLTHQDSDAEDLVQETCLPAFKALDQLRHPRAAKVWVFSILQSVYLREPDRQERTGEYRRHRRVPAQLRRGAPGRVREPAADSARTA